MTQQELALDVPDGYSGAIYPQPVPSGLARSLMHLLAHKGPPWLPDIEARLASAGPDLFAVALGAGEPVAHAWLGSAQECPESGLIGHVYTMEEHRRRGLAGRLVTGLLEQFDMRGGRWAQLHTRNQAAAGLYERLGFRVIRVTGGHGSAVKRRVMLRRGEGQGVGEAYHQASAKWAVEPFERRHYPRLCVFLNAIPGEDKLPALDIDSGAHCEPRLLVAWQGQERGECRCGVLVDAANGRAHGLACRKGDSLGVYAPHVDEAVRDMLADRT